eukprot:COSAG01_NODE_22783_length_841_cov_1.115903_2_plen_110_part_00
MDYHFLTAAVAGSPMQWREHPLRNSLGRWLLYDDRLTEFVASHNTAVHLHRQYSTTRGLNTATSKHPLPCAKLTMSMMVRLLVLFFSVIETAAIESAAIEASVLYCFFR